MIEDKEINEIALQLYNKLMEKPLAIKEIFEDYFGEENVDLWKPTYEDFVTFLENHTINDFKLSEESELSPTQKALIKRNIGEATLVSNYALIQNFGFALLPSIMDLLSDEYSIFIVIYFPKITVTNEYNRSVNIQDVFIRQRITASGASLYKPNLTRSTLTISQFISGYIHSHVHASKEKVPEFSPICTGSGPINSTLTSLAVTYDEDLWRLYCVEIDNLVRVESLAGVPYIKLETITDKYEFISDLKVYSSSWNECYESLNHKDFIKYLISNKVIPFNYANGQYGLGLSFIETVVKISNAFIDWYNSLGSNKPMVNLFSCGLLFLGTINGNKIFERVTCNGNSACTSLQDKLMFSFKGNSIRFHVVEDIATDNVSTFVNTNYISEIVKALLTILNTGYGREDSFINKKTEFV